MVSALWKLDRPLLLASRSATRRLLLESAAIPVETMSPDVDERRVEAGLVDRKLGPDLIALELATAKGKAASTAHPDRLIVSADQTLALDGEMFHKPNDFQEARIQLCRLSGRRHALHSAVTCFRDGREIYARVETAHLTMRTLGPAFVDAYLAAAGAAVTSSVGGYQLEGLGVHLFDRVDGDHSTILGLPLLPLLAFFRSAGIVEA